MVAETFRNMYCNMRFFVIRNFHVQLSTNLSQFSFPLQRPSYFPTDVTKEILLYPFNNKTDKFISLFLRRTCTTSAIKNN